MRALADRIAGEHGYAYEGIEGHASHVANVGT